MAQPAVLLNEKQEVAKSKKIIPKELIYEMRHGKPIYYRDYNKVLNGEKSLEEVMGSSFFQAELIMLIIQVLFKHLDFKKYRIYTNELGFKFAPKSWRNLDIAIFKKEKVQEYIKKKYDEYISVPPEIVIEIDTKADLHNFSSPIDYFVEKTEDLLQAGVKKVIWIFTKVEKVWIAEKNKDWHIKSWKENIEIIEGITLNIHKLLLEAQKM
jgi:Uma2 family endonuclease